MNRKGSKLPMRILSGITPSGEPHIGNYFGAIRQYVELQSKGQAIYFIADYHSMNGVRSATERRRLVREVALDFLACGLDPSETILYCQSDFPELCELTWLLTTVTPMGLLERGHAYKDKLAQGQPADHGLFAYPVLMAADILMYRSDIVPVGQDQKQHIEMARDIAQRFNNIYEQEVFVLPEPYILDDVAVVPGTDGRKMSKSYDNTIRPFWPKGKLKKAVMGVVTDSTPVEEPKNVSSPIFQLWSLFATSDERDDMFLRARSGGLGYGDIKKDLLERILRYFAPMRERREVLEKSPSEVDEVLEDGARRAKELGMPVLDRARQAAGVG